MPGRITIDNSLQAWSASALAIGEELDIAMKWARVKEPTDKDNIEGFFSAVEASVNALMPGSDRRRAGEMERFDPRVHLYVSLDDLDAQLHRFICDVLHQNPVPRLGASPDEFFRHMTAEHPVAYPASIDELDRILGEEHQATLDHNGLWFEGIQYRAPKLLELRMKSGYRLKVRIKVNRPRLDHIYVQCPVTCGWERAEPTAEFAHYARNTSLHVHGLVRKALRDEGQGDEVGVKGLRIGLAKLVENIEFAVLDARDGHYVARLGRALGAEAPHNRLLNNLVAMQREREREGFGQAQPAHPAPRRYGN